MLDKNLISAVASYAVINPKTGRQNCKETAEAATNGLGFEVTVNGNKFFVDGEYLCKVDQIGKLIGTAAKQPTNPATERRTAVKNADKKRLNEAKKGGLLMIDLINKSIDKQKAEAEKAEVAAILNKSGALSKVEREKLRKMLAI